MTLSPSLICRSHIRGDDSLRSEHSHRDKSLAGVRGDGTSFLQGSSPSHFQRLRWLSSPLSFSTLLHHHHPSKNNPAFLKCGFITLWMFRSQKYKFIGCKLCQHPRGPAHRQTLHPGVTPWVAMAGTWLTGKPGISS